MRVNLPDYTRFRTAELLQAGRRRGHGVALQDLGAHLASRDLAQRDDGHLVAVGLDERRGAGTELARTVGRGQREVEAVGDSLQAVVNGDASHRISSGFGALATDDAGELALGGFEVFVNYNVFEFAGVRELLARIRHALADDGIGVLRPHAHAPLELLDRGRQDEDADAVRVEPAHLLRALPVDLENDVFAAGDGIEDHFLRRAVVVAVHLGAFQEFAALAHRPEAALVDEVVVDAILLARPRPARGVGHRDLERRVVAHHRVDERGLPGAGRSGNDEQCSFALLSPCGHSMFWTCSRICSTRSFNSSAQSLSSWLAAFEASVFASRFSSCARKSRRLPAAPPRWSVLSTSARCAFSRVSSSSTSDFAANTAISARTRSSSADPSASRSRSASRA